MLVPGHNTCEASNKSPGAPRNSCQTQNGPVCHVQGGRVVLGHVVVLESGGKCQHRGGHSLSWCQ